MTPFAEWICEQEPVVAGTYGSSSVKGNVNSEVLSNLIAELRVGVVLSEDLVSDLRAKTVAQMFGERQKEFYDARLMRELKMIEDTLTSAVARIISPMVEQEIIRKGITDFCNLLGNHVRKQESSETNISVPQKLYAELQARLSEQGLKANLSKHDSKEITARIGAMEFETEFGSWIEGLRKASAQ
jgi:hypothetical protein